MLNKLKYYFKPNSLTWWSGILMIAFGTLLATEVEFTGMGVMGEVLAGLMGTSAAPAPMILFGLTALGIGARKGPSSGGV